MRLGVNVDHIATLREARKTTYPDPVVGALLCEYAGCDSIVAHLREDRRHVKEKDVFLIKKLIKIPFNLEMSTNLEIVKIACQIKPYKATLVPERRRELTTEGGLDLCLYYSKVKKTIEKLKREGIKISLFLDPTKIQIKKAQKLGVEEIEINTGRYSEAKSRSKKKRELERIKEAAKYARKVGFEVAAGHGLDYQNVKDIARIKDIQELNIGHSIISRAVFVGIVEAVKEMLALVKKRSKWL